MSGFTKIKENTVEIEHFSPYLPYKLQITYKGDTTELTGLHTDEEGLIRGQSIIDVDDNDYPFNSDYWKPVLRPLDSVCDGMNDETPNPCFDELDEGTKDCFRYLSNEEALAVIPYSDMVVLFKYHIDVFGLIEKELAIELHNEW